MLNELDTNPVRLLPSGRELFRCRIIGENSKVNSEKDFYGFGKEESFVPPPEVTRDLRANYRYIPYLYCSNDPYFKCTLFSKISQYISPYFSPLKKFSAADRIHFKW